MLFYSLRDPCILYSVFWTLWAPGFNSNRKSLRSPIWSNWKIWVGLVCCISSSKRMCWTVSWCWKVFVFFPKEDCTSVLRSSLPPASSSLWEWFGFGISVGSPVTALRGRLFLCYPGSRFSYAQGSELNTCVLCSTWKLHDNQTRSLPSRVLTQNFIATSGTSLFLDGRRVAVNLIWETGKTIKMLLRLNTSSFSQTGTRHQNWK